MVSFTQRRIFLTISLIVLGYSNGLGKMIRVGSGVSVKVQSSYPSAWAKTDIDLRRERPTAGAVRAGAIMCLTDNLPPDQALGIGFDFGTRCSLRPRLGGSLGTAKRPTLRVGVTSTDTRLR